MLKKYSLLLALLTASYAIKAQTTLAAGDIAFVMVNETDNSVNSATNDDNVSFVLLKSIASGTQISFTDFGWRTDAAAFQSANPCGASTGAVTDGVVTWTATTALPYGTVVHMNVRNTPGVNIGSITGTTAAYNSTTSPPLYYVSLSAAAGESVIAFQGTTASPTLITAIRLNSSWSTSVLNCDFSPSVCAQPSALTAPGHSFLWGQVGGNGKLKTTVNLTGNPATDLAAIYNVANWDFNSSVAFSNSNLLGVSSFASENTKFLVYPNPASNSITLENKGAFLAEKYTIVDVNGRVLMSGAIVQNLQKIGIESLQNGVYWITIEDNNQKIVAKFIKE